MGDNNGGGISFCGMLAILFIGLKLTGFINWSWLFVLAPIWIPLSISIFIIVAYLLFVTIRYLWRAL